jgi:hypothetical protein
MKHWQDYFKTSYELVIAAEGTCSALLNEDVESYLVRLLTRWFDKNQIPPDTPVAILLMTAMQSSSRDRYQRLAEVADICLFYDGFKIKQRRWPSQGYYHDMGTMAYGMAYVASNDSLYDQLEQNFKLCSRILSNIQTKA